MSVADTVLAEFRSQAGLLPPSEASTTWERFQRIRAAYASHQKRVDQGLASWFFDDPYGIADWVMIFTPIEAAAWSDIRAAGLPLWPQLPVGKFFVDFGNPVAKVALECDGAAWHQDTSKDEARDRELRKMGWRIYRATGRVCKVDFERPEDWDALTPEQRRDWEDGVEANSLKPILRDIRRELEMAGAMQRGKNR